MTERGLLPGIRGETGRNGCRAMVGGRSKVALVHPVLRSWQYGDSATRTKTGDRMRTWKLKFKNEVSKTGMGRVEARATCSVVGENGSSCLCC
jgi:hypothetical protein